MDGTGNSGEEIMKQGCCGGVWVVRLGDSKVGLSGVDRILERFYLQGWLPEDANLGNALLRPLGETGNHIRPTEGPAYAGALGELYHQFCAANAASGEQQV